MLALNTYLLTDYRFVSTFLVPFISGSFIKIKINLNFRPSENLLKHHKVMWK